MTDSGAHAAPATSTTSRDASLGELVSTMSEQLSRLMRDELRLAQAEMTAKAKKAGIGAGLFGGAGLLALYALGCFVAAAILGLAGPVPDWLAALIVGAALFVVVGIAALVGKKEVSAASPPVPTEAIDGVRTDVETLKSGSNV
jgi:Putative Actinobacterial Holin-X, holin superfamily III